MSVHAQEALTPYHTKVKEMAWFLVFGFMVLLLDYGETSKTTKPSQLLHLRVRCVHMHKRHILTSFPFLTFFTIISTVRGDDSLRGISPPFSSMKSPTFFLLFNYEGTSCVFLRILLVLLFCVFEARFSSPNYLPICPRGTFIFRFFFFFKGDERRASL